MSRPRKPSSMSMRAAPRSAIQQLIESKPDAAKSGGMIDIQVRTRGVEAEIVPLPFYSRKKD